MEPDLIIDNYKPKNDIGYVKLRKILVKRLRLNHYIDKRHSVQNVGGGCIMSFGEGGGNTICTVEGVKDTHLSHALEIHQEILHELQAKR